MTRDARLGDAAHGGVAAGSVVVGDVHQRQCDDNADGARHEQVEVRQARAVREGRAGDIDQSEDVDGEKEHHQGQDARDPHAPVKAVHDLRAVLGRCDGEDADDAGEDAQPADHQWEPHQTVVATFDQMPKKHRGNRGHDERFKQISRHARVVTDVVANVIGNHGWVARVVLWDARF